MASTTAKRSIEQENARHRIARKIKTTNAIFKRVQSLLSRIDALDEEVEAEARKYGLLDELNKM